jgi:hypothetical protein
MVLSKDAGIEDCDMEHCTDSLAGLQYKEFHLMKAKSYYAIR